MSKPQARDTPLPPFAVAAPVDPAPRGEFIERGQLFLQSVPTSAMAQESVNGLLPYIDEEIDNGIYSKKEAEDLLDAGVENRMRVKISTHYETLVMGTGGMPASKPLRALVTARTEEVEDLSGEEDPSRQLDYCPLPGLLHKYEMALVCVVKTCSAHCRYCYRLDFFSGKNGKRVAKIDAVVDYIRRYNRISERTEDSKPLREIVLSGGDPMVLSNLKLAQWLSALAEVGIRQIRIGTKELAFRPQRFDDAFFEMLNQFNKFYPDVRLVFVVHFSHSDEFLQRNGDGRFIETSGGCFLWMDAVKHPVEKLSRLGHFVSIENQTPIIRGVNDCPQALRVIQRELFHKGIGNHYFFQCRRIEGHRAFAIPVEETLEIFRLSQIGLSGVESHAKLVMSSQWGKIEIVGDLDDRIVFRLVRNPGDGDASGALAVAKKNPKALWIDDYLPEILSDSAGFLSL